ncbi:unnamed protein product [Citrullus colocynthis]|uniref:Uncharacterized protein n=1 Tax=Citrullus colocynthis TaxID=252529 RepID=A0ABP0Z8H1_9ROSI
MNYVGVSQARDLEINLEVIQIDSDNEVALSLPNVQNISKSMSAHCAKSVMTLKIIHTRPRERMWRMMRSKSPKPEVKTLQSSSHTTKMNTIVQIGINARKIVVLEVIPTLRRGYTQCADSNKEGYHKCNGWVTRWVKIHVKGCVDPKRGWRNMKALALRWTCFPGDVLSILSIFRSASLRLSTEGDGWFISAKFDSLVGVELQTHVLIAKEQ